MTKAFEETIDLLRTRMIGVISTLSEDDLPQSATVFYWIDAVSERDFDLFFVTRRHTRKARNIERNPAVSFVVMAGFEPRTVQIEGRGELVEAERSISHLQHLAKLVERQPKVAAMYTGAFYPRAPFSGLEGKDYAVFRVRPRWARLMTYDEEKKEIVYLQAMP